MGRPHHLCLKVRHYEVDVCGRVNHAHYVHYLETRRIEALDAIGLSIDDMRRQGYLIVVADLFIKYHSPARFGDELDILTHIRELRGARTIWVQEIGEASTQRLIVTAEVTWAFMTEIGRLARPPADFTEKLSAVYLADDRPVPQKRLLPPLRGGENAPTERPHVVDAHHRGDSPVLSRFWGIHRGRKLRQAIREAVRRRRCFTNPSL